MDKSPQSADTIRGTQSEYNQFFAKPGWDSDISSGDEPKRFTKKEYWDRCSKLVEKKFQEKERREVAMRHRSLYLAEQGIDAISTDNDQRNEPPPSMGPQPKYRPAEDRALH